MVRIELNRRPKELSCFNRLASPPIDAFWSRISSYVHMFNEEYFMKQALREAERAYETGEIPVGAVVVCNDLIIARSHNQTELLRDVTAHAEIIALSSAAEYLGSKYLLDCTMYVTLEPCVMCAGALAWAQLGKLVFGASDEKRGFFRYGRELLHPKTIVLQGVLEGPCSALMRDFFKSKRV